MEEVHRPFHSMDSITGDEKSQKGEIDNILDAKQNQKAEFQKYIRYYYQC